MTPADLRALRDAHLTAEQYLGDPAPPETVAYYNAVGQVVDRLVDLWEAAEKEEAGCHRHIKRDRWKERKLAALARLREVG